MKAIRYKDKVYNATAEQYHIDLILELAEREGLSEIDLDKLLEAKELEFGSSYLVDKELVFETDEERTEMYDDMDTIYSCRPTR